MITSLVLTLCACVPGNFDKLTSGGEETDAAADAAPPATSFDASRPDSGVRGLDGAVSTPDATIVIGDGGGGGDDEPGSDAGVECPASLTQQLSVSKPAKELARLAASPLFSSRALGPVARWGATDHVWTFSNARRSESQPAPTATAANHPFVAFDGPAQPWKSVITTPWTLKTPSPNTELPPTMLPLVSGEDALVALIPSSLFRIGTDTKTQMYAVQYDNFTASKVWLATLDDNAVKAKRPAQPLFSAPPLFALAARADGDFISLYACLPATDKVPSRCVAGRVPTAMIGQASAYQVRTLNASNQWVWSNDLQSGTPVLENVAGTDLSISYNNYLRRFVAVYGEPLSNDVVLRTAIQPSGPWSDPVRVALPPAAVLSNQSIREQAPLAQDCERRLVISYFAPTSAAGFLASAGDTVLAAIDLD